MAIDHRPRDVTAILLRCSISGREPYPAPLPHARRPKLGRGHVYWGGWPMLTALLQAVFDVSSCAFLFRQAPRLLDARRRFPVLIALDAPPRVRVSVPQMTAVVGSRRNNVLGPRRVCARPLDGRAALRRTAPVRGPSLPIMHRTMGRCPCSVRSARFLLAPQPYARCLPRVRLPARGFFLGR